MKEPVWIDERDTLTLHNHLLALVHGRYRQDFGSVQYLSGVGRGRRDSKRMAQKRSVLF